MNNLNTPQIRIQNYDIYLNLGYHRQDITRLAGITAVDYHGNDISQAIQVDDRQVNYDLAGQYRILINVQDSEANYAQAAINAIVQRENQTGSATRSNNNYGQNQVNNSNRQPRSKKWVLWVLGIVVLAVIWGFWHQNQQQNQALHDAQSSVSSMSSESASNSSSNSQSVAKIADVNKELKQQISDLKDTVSQYKADNDRTTFENEISNLKQQNTELSNKITQMEQNTATESLSKTVDKLSSTVDTMAQVQSADEAQQALNNAGLNSSMDKITEAINSIKDKLGI